MATLFVGDVHGCARELERLVGEAAADRVVLVGDLFTKGPDPEAVWRLVRDGGFEAVLGNHDDRLLRYVAGERQGDEPARRTVRRLDAVDPEWLGWLRDRPLFLEDGGITVVHAGLHPSGDLDRTTREMALVLRRWPGERPTDPFWWEVYEGARRVVYGHDALRGLVRVERAGVPWTVGLDTGCVYGGRLSGWMPEGDRILQIDAAEVYSPPG